MSRPAGDELSVAVDVAVPQELVWAAATDWVRQRDWMLGTQVHVVAGDGQSVGSRIVAFTGISGLGFLDSMEIIKWEPPRRCQLRHNGELVRGTGTFVVMPSEVGSRFVWSERFELPFGVAGRVGWAVVKPAFEWGLRRSMSRFAEFCREYPN